MKNKVEDYQLLKEGDLVTIDGARNSIGIVTEIKEYGQVQVFWPMTNKTSSHGKKWSELNMRLVENL